MQIKLELIFPADYIFISKTLNLIQGRIRKVGLQVLIPFKSSKGDCNTKSLESKTPIADRNGVGLRHVVKLFFHKSLELES